jgi:anti-sigma regulatory factor (Ser/Thr protein kinase)
MKEPLLLEIPSEVEHVQRVRDVIRDVCLRAGFTAHEAELAVTAVWEAALNAVTHGSPNGNRDRVAIEVTHKDNLLQVDVTSRDHAFTLPDDGPRLDPFSRRGRGLPLIFAFMDRVWLTRDADGVTLHMQKIKKDTRESRSRSEPSSLTV